MPDEEFDEGSQDTNTGDDKTSTNDLSDKEKSLAAQKEHFKTKFEKTAEENAQLKQRLQEIEATKKPDEKANTVDGSNDRLSLIEFSINNKDLDAADVREIADLAKAKNVSLDEARKSPLIEAYLEKKKEANKENDRTFVNRSGFAKPETPVLKTHEDHEKWAKEKFGLH